MTAKRHEHVCVVSRSDWEKKQHVSWSDTFLPAMRTQCSSWSGLDITLQDGTDCGLLVVVFPHGGVRRIRMKGISDWSCSVVSSNPRNPRESLASWDGPSNVRFSHFGDGPTFAGCLRATSLSASAQDVTERATHFVPICWILAERILTADSELLIETDILLAWWFQGRLDHSRSHQGALRMTSIAPKGVGNRQWRVKWSRGCQSCNRAFADPGPWDLGSPASGLKKREI